MLGLAVLLMLPLAFAFRRGAAPRRRRETALALHAAQLEELAREKDGGRIGPEEYQAARLEVERRVLAADALAEAAPDEAAPDGNARLLLAGVIVAVPVLAFALYLPGSTWNVPSEPHAQWQARQQQAQGRVTALIAALRAHLAGLDPDTADASQGQAYLAEALAEQAGQITPEALALFRQSAAHAPDGASWRGLDERRLAEAAGQ